MTDLAGESNGSPVPGDEPVERPGTAGMTAGPFAEQRKLATKKREFDRHYYRSLLDRLKARLHRDLDQLDRQSRIKVEDFLARETPLGPFPLPEFQFMMRVRLLSKKKITAIRKAKGLDQDQKILPTRVLVQQLVVAHNDPLAKPFARWRLACQLFRNVKDYTPPGTFHPGYETVRYSLLRHLVRLMNRYSRGWRRGSHLRRWHDYLDRTGLGRYFRSCQRQGLKIQI